MDRPSPRQQARASTVAAIKRLAREQLASEGAGALSLRAIARELGVVSSAVYRYVPSRDELLTLLIVDAYEELGVVAGEADARCRRSDHRARWLAVGRAVRRWALEHPAEWALVYGTPVTGYAAPAERTVAPATLLPLAVARILVDADEAGALVEVAPVRVGAALRRELEAVAASIGAPGDAAVVARGLFAIEHLVGAVGYELFGHLRDVVTDLDAWHDHQLSVVAGVMGLR